MFQIHRVLVLFPADTDGRRLLREAAGDAAVTFAAEPDVEDSIVREADVIIGTPSQELLKKARSLKWLQLETAGADRYTAKGALPDGVILTTASGAYGLAVSEHIFAVLLEILKKMNLYAANQRARLWKDEGAVGTLYGARVLVVGLGDIGTSFAERAKAFGAHVAGVRRTPGEKPPCVDAVYRTAELNRLLPGADIVLDCLPNSAETRRFFSAERFALMKDGAVFLNCGRGKTVDTEALCDALEAGKLYGAGLDVVEPEPLPAGHRLWALPNVVLTPHVSGGFRLQETVRRVTELCAQNLRLAAEGRMPGRPVRK